jgi:hypothetical protein
LYDHKMISTCDGSEHPKNIGAQAAEASNPLLRRAPSRRRAKASAMAMARGARTLVLAGYTLHPRRGEGPG